MSDEEKWIWDVFGTKTDVFVEFLKGPSRWGKDFRRWVLEHLSERLVDAWLEIHGDEDLLREAADFMECNVMDEQGDPDAERMVEMFAELELERKS
jgi:hypothetical protein